MKKMFKRNGIMFRALGLVSKFRLSEPEGGIGQEVELEQLRIEQEADRFNEQ